MTVPRTAVAPLERRACATTAEAAALRRQFRAWIGALTGDDTADDLSLAVYEALANVVDHAYDERRPGERSDGGCSTAGSGPGAMSLRAIASAPLLTGRDVVVTITDEGCWRPVTDPGWRGRGLPLMRRLTHATSVTTGRVGTVVQLRLRVATDLLPI